MQRTSPVAGGPTPVVEGLFPPVFLLIHHLSYWAKETGVVVVGGRDRWLRVSAPSVDLTRASADLTGPAWWGRGGGNRRVGEPLLLQWLTGPFLSASGLRSSFSLVTLSWCPAQSAEHKLHSWTVSFGVEVTPM